MAIDQESLHRDVLSVRGGVGAWLRGDYTFVRIAGGDASAWLHAQTTNDIASLEPGCGNANARRSAYPAGADDADVTMPDDNSTDPTASEASGVSLN